MGDVVDIKNTKIQDSLDELESFFTLAKESIQSGELMYFGGVLEDDQGTGSLCLTVGKDARLRAASSFCAFSCAILDDALEDSNEQKGNITH